MASQTRSIAPASPPVYIIDGARTPFLKARGRPGPFTPVDMAVQCGRPLLMRNNLPPSAFDQVILGCVNVISEEMNPARVAARSEEHTSELQSRGHLVCRLLLENNNSCLSI